ncbi:probable LRR receptor-like serine/threonine-protein kinase At3g47570 [Trifolium pratense]|uniref:probable LRR receptor-like serine/threonine-protein kinase At3g47570 n=1 Tax=Trifolium pratense TaxID=57577 RepID=UPI001E694597|nr:probable LRR receptor-like serine/threonine-protein kinase At3g47570 [Trifolium pratense]
MAKLCSSYSNLLCILSVSLYYFFFTTCLAKSTKNITTDEFSLLAFKSSITLDPYHMLSNWSISTNSSSSSSFSSCNWVGVTCDEHHGRINALNLSNMGLEGTISPQLGNLSFLVFLDLQGNNFHGELPQELLQLHRLKWLDLSYNNFVGEIPLRIGDLSKLQYLDLGYNKIVGYIPQSISNLSMLEYLDWKSNLVKGTIPHVICQLGRLRILDVRNNKLSGIIPSTISNMSSLEEIHLSNNSLSGEIPKGIGDLTQLTILNLQNNLLFGNISSTILMFNNSSLQKLALGFNNLSGILPSNVCQGLPNLKLLYLYVNDFSGKMPNIWRFCKELEDLELSFNNFDKGHMPPDIGNLIKLQSLYLTSVNLEGEIPLSLFNISSLMEINLNGNNLYGTLPQEMCNQLPQLEIFTLFGNHFEGAIPRSIGNCTLLQSLTLQNNFFSGSIPMEIGNLNQLQLLQMGNNSLSGPIPSKIFNISTLEYLHLEQNSFTGMLPSNMGFGLPNLQQIHIYGNKLAGKIPNSISNASNLVIIDLSSNEFSGNIPNSFGNLRVLESLIIAGNNLTIDDSLEFDFLTSLTSCRYLKHLEVSKISFQSKLPKSIGNLTLEHFWANSCGINGNIPLEIGNMSNLIRLSLSHNDFRGSIPSTIKGLHKLQSLDLSYNGLQGSIVHELCEIRSLSELNLTNNKLFGELPTCLGNLTSLRKFDLGSNRLTSTIPSSFWTLKDVLEVNLSSNAIIGDLPPMIKNLRALVSLDLSRNQISSNIPSTISFLTTLETLSLAYNKIKGPIPKSLGEMVGLSFLDLSQNLITGEIPKSLESLSYLKYINLSYNRLQGEIPNGGPFKKFTSQSFMHNEALCGSPYLLFPLCDKQIRKKSKTKMILITCISSLIVVLGIAWIILQMHKRKKVEKPLEKDLSTNLGLLRRLSYSELVQATNGFSESNLLGRGGFGSVYQGMLSSGKMVAIKVLDLKLEATSKSFDAECNAMRNLRHRNLVEIITSCSNVNFKSLVMEFMSNGSLEKWLYSNNHCLGFLQRLNIMIDVASALEYLHHGSSIPVVHCDLKPSNVLLDENMVAHVGDFGISKLLDEGHSKAHTQTLATIGYVAPEYGSKGVVSVKGDVYSYGIMLMEMFTGKKPTNEMFAEELTLKMWISESMHNSIIEVVDCNLVSQHGKEIQDILVHVSSILALALRCCEDSPEARVSMTNVTASLMKIKTLFI